MHAKVLRIHWHDKKPVYSQDFDPNNANRLVTAGGDNNIRVWRLKRQQQSELSSDKVEDVIQADYCATLSRHIKSVNCVRFSHSGSLLASAGDGGSVIIWRQTDGKGISHNQAIFGAIDDDSDNDDESKSGDLREYWQTVSTLRASDGEDIYDLCWSPDDRFILIGLTDNTAQLWDLTTNKCQKVLRDHGHFVQGVAWDPLGTFLVTISADRSAKVWQLSTVKKTGILQVTSIQKLRGRQADEEEKKNSLFFDETLVSFFRRPAFSPDGAILLLPCGLIDNVNCIHVLSRAKISGFPICHIKGFNRPVLGIRFNPRLFCKSATTTGLAKPPLFDLPYRLIWAAYTMDSVFVFDSQQAHPIASIKDLHYGSMTDAAWSPDGYTLTVSATDGFCSILKFTIDDIGETLEKDKEQEIFESIKERLIPPTNKTESVELTTGLGELSAEPTELTEISNSMVLKALIAPDPFTTAAANKSELPLAKVQSLAEIPSTTEIHPSTEIPSTTEIHPSTEIQSSVATTPSVSLSTEPSTVKRRIQPTLIQPSL